MSADQIRLLNDTFRLDPIKWGRLLVTRGVAALGNAFVAKVTHAVRVFDDFNNSNDPHHEHDFGSFDVDGHTLFWKIDYYDKGSNYTSGAEHPENKDTTDRVLTIMLAEEYGVSACQRQFRLATI